MSSEIELKTLRRKSKATAQEININKLRRKDSRLSFLRENMDYGEEKR